MLRAWSWLIAFAVVSWATASLANPPRAMALDASPLLGPTAPSFDGWFTIAVRLANLTEGQIEGHVEVTSELKYVRDDTKSTTRAPFAVPARGEVALQLPTHGWVDSAPDIGVAIVSSSGEVLASVALPNSGAPGPHLFDLTTPSRIASSVRDKAIPVSFMPTSRSLYSYPQLTVGSPGIVAKTGDPVLPLRAAGYAAATVVLAKSEQVTRLTGPELTALTNWILSGGSLAIVMSRPEDSRHATLGALIGGAPTESRAPAALTRAAVFRVVPKGSSGGSWGGPTPTSRVSLEPQSSTAAELVGYSGGNLHESQWGASASYGLGEVHLLAFDPTRAPYVDDRWVQLKMLDLARHSWERRAHVVLPHAASALDKPAAVEIRKVLDPNEGTRWAVAVAALLLLAYSVLAGPVNFMRAARQHRPLRALIHLPIWAAGAMASIIVLGVASKGVSGSARHVTLIEAGAGMGKAAVTRYRGFYSSSADQITVFASETGNVLDVAGESDDTGRVVVVDRDGARLENMQAKPWQTVVVREDGFTDVGGGVSIVKDGQDTAIVNRTARDLVGVVAKTPGESAVFFDEIADGGRVLVSAGEVLSTRIGDRGSRLRNQVPLDIDALPDDVKKEHDRGLDGWRALEHLVYGIADWWPEDTPTLIAQIRGGEGRDSDSGLRLEQDRVYLRVVGYGGVP